MQFIKQRKQRMPNLLLKYFQQRMDNDPPALSIKEPGPVVTISREYGCPGKIVAEQLNDKINQHYNNSWKWISKEILEQLAEELKLKPSVIEDINNFKDRGFSDYFALLLSKSYFPGEKRIKNAFHDILLSIANEGNAIIVGRAGYYITNHLQKSYHVRLYAPLEWRVDRFSEKRELSYQDAMKQVEDMNKNRLQFLEYFRDNKKQNKPFNQEFDCSVNSIEQIVDQIWSDLEKTFLNDAD